MVNIASNKGGKRTGAGRPPTKDVAVREEEPVSAVTLTPQQKSFITYIVRGMKYKDICKIMGISLQTTKNWRNSDWYAIAEAEERQKLVGNPYEIFAPMLPKAIKSYDAALDEGNLAVASSVFDHLVGKPPVRGQSEGNVSVVINFLEIGSDTKYTIEAEDVRVLE